MRYEPVRATPQPWRRFLANSGHGLGGPLSAYLSGDVQLADANVMAALIAPPKSGNTTYAWWLTGRVDVRGSAAELDWVPKWPPGPDYAPFPHTLGLPWHLRPPVRFDTICQHYGAMYFVRICAIAGGKSNKSLVPSRYQGCL